MAQVNKNKGKSEHLGFFNTELEAFNTYKQAKESFVKEQANKWKGKIDERAYLALMNYECTLMTNKKLKFFEQQEYKIAESKQYEQTQSEV